MHCLDQLHRELPGSALAAGSAALWMGVKRMRTRTHTYLQGPAAAPLFHDLLLLSLFSRLCPLLLLLAPLGVISLDEVPASVLPIHRLRSGCRLLRFRRVLLRILGRVVLRCRRRVRSCVALLGRAVLRCRGRMTGSRRVGWTGRRHACGHGRMVRARGQAVRIFRGVSICFSSDRVHKRARDSMSS